MPGTRLSALSAASLTERIRLILSIDESALEPLVREVETVQNKREQTPSSVAEEKTTQALEIDLGLEAIAASISSVPAKDRSVSIGSFLRSVCSVLAREKMVRSGVLSGSMALLTAVIAESEATWLPSACFGSNDTGRKRARPGADGAFAPVGDATEFMLFDGSLAESGWKESTPWGQPLSKAQRREEDRKPGTPRWPLQSLRVQQAGGGSMRGGVGGGAGGDASGRALLAPTPPAMQRFGERASDLGASGLGGRFGWRNLRASGKAGAVGASSEFGCTIAARSAAPASATSASPSASASASASASTSAAASASASASASTLLPLPTPS